MTNYSEAERHHAFVFRITMGALLFMAATLVTAFLYVSFLPKEPVSKPPRIGATVIADALKDGALVKRCESLAAGIEFFQALEKRPTASWTRWVVIDGHCYVSSWDEVWTCDEAEKQLAELKVKHLEDVK